MYVPPLVPLRGTLIDSQLSIINNDSNCFQYGTVRLALSVLSTLKYVNTFNLVKTP